MTRYLSFVCLIVQKFLVVDIKITNKKKCHISHIKKCRNRGATNGATCIYLELSHFSHWLLKDVTNLSYIDVQISHSVFRKVSLVK